MRVHSHIVLDEFKVTIMSRHMLLIDQIQECMKAHNHAMDCMVRGVVQGWIHLFQRRPLSHDQWEEF